MINYSDRRVRFEIDSMTREELIGAILGVSDGRHLRFVRAWLERQPDTRLRLLLTAARTYRWLGLRNNYKR
jgi:hypothetical protein